MRQANKITIKITRFGSETQEVSAAEDSTLADVLEAAGISLSPSETPSVNGVAAKDGDMMDEGDTIQIIGKKEGGR